jgi:hypothetical protein
MTICRTENRKSKIWNRRDRSKLLEQRFSVETCTTFHAATQTRWGPKGKNEHSKRAEVRLPQSCILKSPLSRETFLPPVVYKSILEEQKCETAMRTPRIKTISNGWVEIRIRYAAWETSYFRSLSPGSSYNRGRTRNTFQEASALYLGEADWTTWSYGVFLKLRQGQSAHRQPLARSLWSWTLESIFPGVARPICC